jgi:hypothetical protein
MKSKVAETVMEHSTTPSLAAISVLIEIHRKCPVAGSGKADGKDEGDGGSAAPSRG